jgi:hypothetical protein
MAVGNIYIFGLLASYPGGHNRIINNHHHTKGKISTRQIKEETSCSYGPC